MADNEQIKFQLNLDTTEFNAAADLAKQAIGKLSDIENFSGLLENLTKVGGAIGLVTVAALAVKKAFTAAFDLTMEGEQIEKISQQFEIFAKQSGISAEVLKTGLEEQAKGLVSNDDLLKIANQSMITLGSSSSKLPDILEISRKAANLFGQDTKTVFESFNQAISTGNTRLLRQYGIVVDQKKAIDDYAEANGLAANSLSKFGQTQAYMNAIMDQAHLKFANVKEDTTNVTSQVQQLKVMWQELGNVWAVTVEQKIAPAIKTVLGYGKSLLQWVNTLSLNTGKYGGIYSQAVSQIKAKDSDLAATGKLMEKVAGPTPQAMQQSLVNQQIATQNYKKFRDDITKIDADSEKSRQILINSTDQIENTLEQQKVVRAQQFAQKILAIQTNADLTRGQKRAEVAAQNQQFILQEQAAEQQEAAERRKLLDQYQKNSKNTFDGIARAYKVTTAKNKAESADFGAQGAAVMASFQANSLNAFSAMGAAVTQGADIASSAAKAVGASLLGPIADYATAKGSAMLLDGLWPPNPIALSAGAGLIALGGALKSVSGGLLSSMTPSSGGGGGGSPAGTTDPCAIISQAKTCQTAGTSGPLPSSTDTAAAANTLGAGGVSMDTSALAIPQKTVNVHIAGNYFDTDSSRTALMDIIRQSTDATDFNYYKLGVGG